MLEKFRVVITEVHLVPPAVGTPRHELPVSTFDMMQKGNSVPYLQRVAFYPSGAATEFAVTVANLLQNFADALVYFYPLAGRLKFTVEGRPVIDCNNYGAEFSVAVTNAKLDDIDVSQYSPLFRKLIQRGNYEEITMTGTAPFVAIQVTKFKCGAIAVAWSFDHLVTNGVGMMHFLKSWAEISSGESISVLPDHDRLFEHRNGTLTGGSTATGTLVLRYKFVDSAFGVISRVFFVSEEEIEKLKRMAESTSKRSFSTFQIVAAYLWLMLCKARNLPSSQITRAFTAIDCRRRIVPQLPTGYFGNLMLPGVAESTAGEIGAGDLGAIATRLQSRIRKFGMDDIRSQLSDYKYQKNIMDEGIHNGVDIFFGSSSRHPLYELNFGFKKPIAVRHARFLWDGFCFVDPSRGGDKDLEVTVHLPPKIMYKFSKFIFHK